MEGGDYSRITQLCLSLLSFSLSSFAASVSLPSPLAPPPPPPPFHPRTVSHSLFLVHRENSNLRLEQTLRTLAEERSSNEWQCARPSPFFFTLISSYSFVDSWNQRFLPVRLSPPSYPAHLLLARLPLFCGCTRGSFCLRIPRRYLSLKLFHLLDSRTTPKFRLF